MTETATLPQRTLPPDIADFCRRAVEALRAKLPVREVWLFGSHAEGRASEHSDVDLFVVLADDHGLKDPSLECRRALDGIRPSPRRDLDISVLDESYWHHPRYRGFGLWSDVAEKGVCLFESGEFFRPTTGPLPLKPGDPTVPESWYERARRDFSVARLLLSDHIEGAVTSFEQSAEKLMKGWLIERGWRLIKTHELDDLCIEVERRGVPLDWFSDRKTLTKISYQLRYPGPEVFLTGNDVEEIAGRIERLFRELNIEL